MRSSSSPKKKFPPFSLEAPTHRAELSALCRIRTLSEKLRKTLKIHSTSFRSFGVLSNNKQVARAPKSERNMNSKLKTSLFPPFLFLPPHCVLVYHPTSRSCFVHIYSPSEFLALFPFYFHRSLARSLAVIFFRRKESGKVCAVLLLWGCALAFCFFHTIGSLSIFAMLKSSRRRRKK